MSKRIKIGFMHLGNPRSFMMNDLEILQKKYDVHILNLPANFKFILFWWKIIILVYKSDIIFSWFADIHTGIALLICKIFKKKLIVSVGGYDVARVPEIKYGIFCYSPIRRLAAKLTLMYADKILAVDQSLKNDAIKNAGIIGENIIVLPTGYDSNKWKFIGEKEDLVITVGSINWSVVKRKGFETFIKASEYFPDVQFVIIGKYLDNSIDYLKSIAGQNIKFTDFISDEELIKYNQRAKVYCQLSLYEGLPNALCEAMLCECVPVGTKNCGIPTAIGDTGFYAPYGNQKAVAQAIKKALNSPKEYGRFARKRIIDNFKFEDRERKIFDIIGGFVE